MNPPALGKDNRAHGDDNLAYCGIIWYVVLVNFLIIIFFNFQFLINNEKPNATIMYTTGSLYPLCNLLTGNLISSSVI